jgi:hypothetical protein
MTNDDNSRTAARAAKTGAQDGDNGRAERDAAAKAALDNMARLKALRLAREAAQPQSAASAKTKRGTSGAKVSGARTSSAKTSGSHKADDRARPLSEWLAEQQSGGRRT